MDLFRGHGAHPGVGIVEGTGGVRHEGDAIAPKHRVTGGGMTAILRGDTGDDHRLDPPAPEHHVEVRAEERAVAVLLDDDFIRLGREIVDYLAALRLIDEARALLDRLPDLSEQPQIRPVGAVDVRRVDHLHPGVSGVVEKLCDPRKDRAPHRGLQRRAGEQKVVLHIHHDERCALRVDLVDHDRHEASPGRPGAGLTRGSGSSRRVRDGDCPTH